MDINAQKRQEMPKQPIEERIHNFKEVSLGYTPKQAVAEAGRCLQCRHRPCVSGCPVNIDIPGFIDLLAKGDFAGAVRRIREKSVLPAVCGRVCPQEDLCEAACVLNKKARPVAIGRLERFAADTQFESGAGSVHPISSAGGKKAAVIGSGPSGITAAGCLAQAGHKVTIFEAFHAPGGVLIYGIPEFRLPKHIVQKEIDVLLKMGVETRLNCIIGRTKTIKDLRDEGFSVIYISAGAGTPRFLNLPGENLNGVYSANEFLTRINLMKAYLFPEYSTPVYCGRKAVVIGGGNTAIDAARSILRLGPQNVTVIYRRSENEMPARIEEIENAKEEGVKFRLLASPIRFTGNNKGWLTGVECIEIRLGADDETGRRRPVPVPDSNFIIPADTAVISIGTSPNRIITSTTPGIKTTEKGYIRADSNTGQTSIPYIFAGGDITTGEATVISAMAAAKRASAAMCEFLSV